jgi:hypothetical protein
MRFRNLGRLKFQKRLMDASITHQHKKSGPRLSLLILSNRLGRKNERPIDSREIALIYRFALLVEIVASLEYVTQVSLASRLPKKEDDRVLAARQ